MLAKFCEHFIFIKSINCFTGEIMSFSEIVKQTVYTNDFPAPTFRATIIGDNAIYLESVLSIKEFTKESITLRLKKGGITISGKELFIKKYCAGDMVVCGKIESFQRI